MDGEISHADGWADAPPILFLEAPKRECAAPGGREKTLRRVGLRQRRPPAAGGGRLAVPRGGQGRKRAVLGETFGPGKSGIPAAPIFAAAGRLLMKATAWANATAPTPARAARSEAERAEREAGQMRPCTPTPSAPSATGRQLQESQKTIACPKAGQNRSRHRYADPPHSAEARRCRSTSQRPFLLDRARPVFFSGKTEKKMGGASSLDKPPGGSQPPVAAVRRPKSSPGS